MKRSFLTLVLAVAGMVAANAQTPTPSTEQNWTPNIEFEKETHDYGTVKHGGDGTCEFKFKNTGKEAFVITNARGSCGCTVPEWPKEEIAPGKEGPIRVSYDTKRPGAINKNVTLTIQNKEKDKTGTKTLYIKGNVEPAPADAGSPEKKSGMAPLEGGK